MGCMGLFVRERRLLILCLRKIGEAEPRGGGLGLLSPSRARTETIPLNRAPRNCAVCHRSESELPGWGRQAQIRHSAAGGPRWRAHRACRHLAVLFTLPCLSRLRRLEFVSAGGAPPKHSTTTRCRSATARGGAAHASPLTWCRRRGGASSLPPACQGVPPRREHGTLRRRGIQKD